MPGTKTHRDSSRLSLADIQPFPTFARQCERDGIATTQQLRWAARYRHTNGLIESGALVEKRVNPSSRKPKLYVVVPRFVGWLSTNEGEQ